MQTYKLKTSELVLALQYCATVNETQFLLKISKTGWSFQAYDDAVTSIVYYQIPNFKFEVYQFDNVLYKVKNIQKHFSASEELTIEIDELINEEKSYHFKFTQQSQIFKSEYTLLDDKKQDWVNLTAINTTTEIYIKACGIAAHFNKLESVDSTVLIEVLQEQILLSANNRLQGIAMQRRIQSNSTNVPGSFIKFKITKLIKAIFKLLNNTNFLIAFNESYQYLKINAPSDKVTNYFIVALEVDENR